MTQEERQELVRKAFEFDDKAYEAFRAGDAAQESLFKARARDVRRTLAAYPADPFGADDPMKF